MEPEPGFDAEGSRRRRAALLTLLRDDDPAAVALVKAQLAAIGPDELPELQLVF